MADVTEDTDRIIAETVGMFGKLDVLINNAAIAYNAELLGTLEAYDHLMNNNVRSVLTLN